jgi:hypothetical protein
MLSPKEIAKIKSEIELLEKGREQCTDGGLKKLIEARIAELRQKLESESRQH